MTKIEYACIIVIHPIYRVTGKANGHNSMNIRYMEKWRFYKWESGHGYNQ